tara:strand:+ start:18176 stop:19204 length:1029 start_codon:yes stop_codon:yes gene_type:complete
MVNRKNKYQITYFLAAVFLALIITQCQFRPRGEGVENEIIIFSTEEMRFSLKRSIDSVFNRIIYIPSAETIFDFRFVNPDKFSEYKHYHNLIILSDLKPESSVTPLVTKVFGKKEVARLRKGGPEYFSVSDVFARDQLVLVVTGKNKNTISAFVEEKSDSIFSWFDEALYERQKKRLFGKIEDKKLTSELFDKYGWCIRVDRDYTLLKEDPDNHFVKLGRAFPIRWLSIQWQDVDQDFNLSKSQASNTVHLFFELNLKALKISDYYFSVERSRFNKWDSWLVNGLWEHKTDIKGGPFKSYIFYDNLTKRIYHVNLLMFHPGENKLLLLRELDMLAQTFSVSR